MKSLRTLTLFILSFLFLLFSGNSEAPAHPGKLDENCGHHNRETGEYHYHYKNCKPELYKQIRKATHKGKVLQVKDGDTIIIAPLEGGQFFTCRLYGIDAPETPKRGEPGQPFGEEATRELKKLVLGHIVNVTFTGEKSYKREICFVEKDGMGINREMVKRGYAWAYREYLEGPYASEYIDAENEAKEKGLGLWKQKNPLPPWEFRKRH